MHFLSLQVHTMHTHTHTLSLSLPYIPCEMAHRRMHIAVRSVPFKDNTLAVNPAHVALVVYPHALSLLASTLYAHPCGALQSPRRLKIFGLD